MATTVRSSLWNFFVPCRRNKLPVMLKEEGRSGGDVLRHSPVRRIGIPAMQATQEGVSAGGRRGIADVVTEALAWRRLNKATPFSPMATIRRGWRVFM